MIMKTPVYNTQGKKTGDIDLPEAVFGVAWNGDLVHQVLSAQRVNRQTPTTHAKDRRERAGGGAKPWRQKGTGRARHGSRRSPIWRKGGVTHGPRNEKNLSRSVPTKMKRKALHAILSQKLRDGHLIFVDDVNFEEPKTAEAKKVLTNIASADSAVDVADRRRNSAYIALPERRDTVSKSFRNLGNVSIDEVHNMNPLDVARYKYVVIVAPETSLNAFQGAQRAQTSK